MLLQIREGQGLLAQSVFRHEIHLPAGFVKQRVFDQWAGRVCGDPGDAVEMRRTAFAGLATIVIEHNRS